MHDTYHRLSTAGFADKIVEWSVNNPRPLPWKDFRDPYSIWISEIILQQTRVKQGLPYFLSFIKHFPNVQSLANASEDEVLQQWEGLGYYSRARNLRTAAIQIVVDYKGKFPKNYKDLLSLKGVGPYTASAIASFAYELPHGVVDGNVKRVVSRIFGIHQAIDDPATIREIQSLVDEAVSTVSPSAFNQAIMDFGATYCVPQNPACSGCDFKEHCYANGEDCVAELPYKAKKVKKVDQDLYFAIHLGEDGIALTQEKIVSFWKGLYCFPMMSEEDVALKEKYTLVDTVEWHLTHRKLTLHFCLMKAKTINLEENKGWTIVNSKNLRKFAVPRPLRLFLNKNSCNLGLNSK